jgi:hypothetical protein
MISAGKPRRAHPLAINRHTFALPGVHDCKFSAETRGASKENVGNRRLRKCRFFDVGVREKTSANGNIFYWGKGFSPVAWMASLAQ